jgi:hypothetical protein
MDKSKIKIKIKIADQEVEMTMAEAQELKEILCEMFPAPKTEVVKEYLPSPAPVIIKDWREHDWWQPPIITYGGSSADPLPETYTICAKSV